MDRDSVTKLRLDRRLFRRRGWIHSSEREQAIEALPDTAAKATTLGEVADERESGGAAEAAPAEAAPLEPSASYPPAE